MTKEELKREAEEWIRKNSKEFITNPKYSPFDYAEAIYLAGAEPREKHIAELESQIEKLKLLLNEIYSEYGFSALVKIRNDLPLEIQEVIKEIKRE